MSGFDHAKEARALLGAARNAHDPERLVAEAQVHATLALAAEQRTAGLPAPVLAVAVVDSRIAAWHAIADHPALAGCYDDDRPLIDAVLDRLTVLAALERAPAVEARHASRGFTHPADTS